MKADIFPTRTVLDYDEDDECNSAYFPYENGYFTIARNRWIEDEDDPEFYEPYMEIDDQAYGQYGGIESIVFSKDRVSVHFRPESLLAGSYDEVCLNFSDPVSREMSDFFANALFLGSLISYDPTFPPENIVEQTSFQELWVDEDEEYLEILEEGKDETGAQDGEGETGDTD